MRKQRDKQHRKTVYDAELYELPLQLSGSLLGHFQKKGIKTVAQFMNTDEEKFFEDMPDNKRLRKEFAETRAQIDELIRRDGDSTGAKTKPKKKERQQRVPLKSESSERISIHIEFPREDGNFGDDPLPALDAVISDYLDLVGRREAEVLRDRTPRTEGFRTLNAIGDQYGFTRERTRQIEESTVQRLYTLLSEGKARYHSRVVVIRPSVQEAISSLLSLLALMPCAAERDINELMDIPEEDSAGDDSSSLVRKIALHVLGFIPVAYMGHAFYVNFPIRQIMKIAQVFADCRRIVKQHVRSLPEDTLIAEMRAIYPELPSECIESTIMSFLSVGIFEEHAEGVQLPDLELTGGELALRMLFYSGKPHTSPQLAQLAKEQFPEVIGEEGKGYKTNLSNLINNYLTSCEYCVKYSPFGHWFLESWGVDKDDIASVVLYVKKTLSRPTATAIAERLEDYKVPVSMEIIKEVLADGAGAKRSRRNGRSRPAKKGSGA